MRRSTLGTLAAIALSLGVGVAAAQGFNPWKGPAAEDAVGSVLLCSTGVARDAGACGVAARPVVVSGTVAATQSGTWRVIPTIATPVAGATNAVGVTSTSVLAVNASRRWLFIQNPAQIGGAANTAHLWCNPAGSAAVAGAPSIHIPPGQIFQMGDANGPVTGTLVACIASAAASPVVAWQN